MLKEDMVTVLDCRVEWLAREKLDEWIRWARRSRLEPFKRVVSTIANTPTETSRALWTGSSLQRYQFSLL